MPLSGGTTLNPFEPTVRLCRRKLHMFDRLKHKQCPECQALAQSSSTPKANLSPGQLYKQLWRVLCRDAHSFEDQVRKGKHLNHMQSKQLLEYLKFLQDVKALDELEKMEEKHGKESIKPGSAKKVAHDDIQTTDDGDGDSGTE